MINNKDNPPIIIGGVGGSGTRILTKLLMNSGYFMGSNLNESLDSLDFEPFYENCIRPYLDKKEHSDFVINKMRETFNSCLSIHLSQCPDQNTKWGFKNPRFILILPFLHEIFPQIKFIHVIRDGKDMAFSSNQNQQKLYGDILCPNENPDSPLFSLRYWSLVNLEGLAYGTSKLNDNYLLVRFEDLVDKIPDTIKKISNFVGVDVNKFKSGLDYIKKPSTIGRWKMHEQELISMSDLEKDALSKFGYSD